MSLPLRFRGQTVYAGGNFMRIAGQARNRIAALDAASGIATSWDPNANIEVLAIDVSDSAVYIGGQFTTIGGLPQPYFAQFDRFPPATPTATPSPTQIPSDFSSTPREQTWMTDGVVRAIVHTADTVYLGGDFTYVGPNTGSGVPISTSTGALPGAFPKVNGTVNACVPDGSGGWFIGGYFTRVGSSTRNRIAHILSDYTVDATWDPNANGTVHSLAVLGTTVYAGGDFTNIGGQTRNRIAALDAAAAGAATAWNPDANSTVRALVVSGTTVYAGGDFMTVGGQPHNYIAALDASTGSVNAWDPGATGTVNALAVSGTTVYAGGGFTGIGWAWRNQIAALDATTGFATGWNPSADGAVLALAVSGTTVYAGGGFMNIGGQARSRIAALNAASGAATSWDPNANSTVYSLVVSGTTVYAGGQFTSIGGQNAI